MKKNILWLLLAAMLFSGCSGKNTVNEPVELPDKTVVSGDTSTSIVLDGTENSQYVMAGQNGAIILVETISDAEYDERTRAYSVSGPERTIIPTKPFYVMLENESNGDFKALFFKTHIGQDTFVFPADLGGYGFAYRSEKNVYLAFTDCGIWKIDPVDETAVKITADLYMGQPRDEIAKKKRELITGDSLFWVDSVTLSPDGKYVVYRTNRDTEDTAKTSVWKIDLHSGAESQLVEPAINNDIVGFIGIETLVVGSLQETCLVNVADGKRTAVDIPDLSNRTVRGVNNGIIVITSYQDGSYVTTAFIGEVDMATGALTERVSVEGYLAGEFVFSPSGSKLVIGYGEDAMRGTNDAIIVDVVTNKHSRATELIGSNESLGNIVRRYFWLDDNTLLLNV